MADYEFRATSCKCLDLQLTSAHNQVPIQVNFELSRDDGSGHVGRSSGIVTLDIPQADADVAIENLESKFPAPAGDDSINAALYAIVNGKLAAGWQDKHVAAVEADITAQTAPPQPQPAAASGLVHVDDAATDITIP